jgi:type III pantothenate kinase
MGRDLKRLLVLDVGNTNIHLGLFQGDRLLDQWRLGTPSGHTADELGLKIRQFLLGSGHDPGDLDGTAVASVVPNLEGVIRGGLERFLGGRVFFIEPGRHRTLPIRYLCPSEVGADRLANAVAGVRIAGTPLVIVDFGTATTFDVVSPGGEYLGGAIVPGIEISVGALFSKAARLPMIDLVPSERVIGRNTVESMRSGIVHGYAGLVDHLNRLIFRELGRKARVLATGGLAGIIVPYSATLRRIEPTLTLEGIRLIHHMNRRPARTGGGRARRSGV